MSDVRHLFMESLTDKDGRLQIEVSDYMNNKANSRYRITFENYPAYRNILEVYRLHLWQRRAETINSDAKGWAHLLKTLPGFRSDG